LKGFLDAAILSEDWIDEMQWLEYFTHALSEQMQEIKTRGEVVIRSDILEKWRKF